MNREEIKNMPAGPALNALIAEHFFGWKWVEGKTAAGEFKMLTPPDGDKRHIWAAEWDEEGRPSYLDDFSGDIERAFDLSYHFDLFDHPYFFVEAYANRWRSNFSYDTGNEAWADTPALAICIAAELAYLSKREKRA